MNKHFSNNVRSHEEDKDSKESSMELSGPRNEHIIRGRIRKLQDEVQVKTRRVLRRPRDNPRDREIEGVKIKIPSFLGESNHNLYLEREVKVMVATLEFSGYALV
ncbi:hypothetical protein CR513_13404, partial [Mucuna pruriens]